MAEIVHSSAGCVLRNIAAVLEEKLFGVKFMDTPGGLLRYIIDQELKL